MRKAKTNNGILYDAELTKDQTLEQLEGEKHGNKNKSRPKGIFH